MDRSTTLLLGSVETTVSGTYGVVIIRAVRVSQFGNSAQPQVCDELTIHIGDEIGTPRGLVDGAEAVALCLQATAARGDDRATYVLQRCEGICDSIMTPTHVAGQSCTECGGGRERHSQVW